MILKVLERVRKIGGDGVRVVAVSKYVDAAAVAQLAQEGQLEFGENKVQDLVAKKNELKSLNLSWHFIGRLQSNKINQLLSANPTMWQSCESVQKALAVDARLTCELPTLLQINSADEDSKQGFSLHSACDAWHEIGEKCKNIKLLGVMSIGAHSDEKSAVVASFEATRRLFDDLSGAKICSMGMSGDFEIALKCGSNMLRLGSILFK
ncbi:YggS family pyridoxal phosphate-dependent enzyme [Campylobacter sp. 19-13652]|uniref:YggS family pyridoxal phosphate-dependent enzyme n=1 Tax=Campylobacter sp. 19-13652 TaxID=2840180 RepID=UPI001C77EEE6|nr:YggS family pyridoxal phosphate-dependent enzyme [Campylobacter sp. 19-13652]BCX79460.1 YggS family pyridoxal phosphate enzyme [Campylobacter sp. 19-13652]